MRLISVTKLMSLASFATFFLMLSGCSAPSETKNVTINFPDWAQLQAASYAQQSMNSSPTASALPGPVNRIVINASGPGVTNPVPFLWERKDGDTSPPPLSISFSVAKGALVQALAIVGGSGSIQFYYGDAGVAGADDQILDITLLNVASSQTLIAGNVTGRYLTSANDGPTGIFDYRFVPPGKPSMIVGVGEAFSGWLKAFALSTPLIQYTSPNGAPMFSFTSTTNDLLSTTNAARSARILIPDGFQNDRSDGLFNMLPIQATQVTVGYFGPYADTDSPTHRVCMTDATVVTPDPVDRLFKNASTNDPTAAPMNQMGWVARHATTDFTQIGVVDAGTGYGYGGTVAGSCNSGGNLYSDYLVLDHKKLRSADDILGFKGPFQKLSSGKYLDANFNGATSALDLKFALLPGAASALDGVSLFWRKVSSGSNSSDDEIKISDGYRCNELRNKAAFTNPFTEVAVPASGTLPVGTSIPGLANAAAPTFVQVVACPRSRAGFLFRSAVTSLDYGPTPTLAIGLAGQPWDPVAKKYYGLPYPIYAGMSPVINLTALTATGIVDNIFSQSSPSALNIQGNNGINVSPSFLIWSLGATSTSTLSLSAGRNNIITAGGSGTGLGKSSSPTFNVIGQPTILNVASIAGSVYDISTCQPMLVSTTTNGDATYSPVVGASLAITINSAIGGTFYSNANCSGSTFPPLTPTNSTALIYFQPASSNGGYDINVLPAQSWSSYTKNFSSLIASPPGPATQLRIAGIGSVNMTHMAGACEPYMVMTSTSSGDSNFPSSGVLGTITTSGLGQFFSAAGCISGGFSSISMAISSASRAQVFYYQSATSDTLTATQQTGACFGSTKCSSGTFVTNPN